MSETIHLISGAATAEIALLGAEARAWRIGGRDLLWPGDPAIWPQISPLLFPVVGWTRDGARVAERQYALGLHGFAARKIFHVERATSDHLRLTLRDDEETRAIYPFSFRFAAEYRLTAAALEMTLEVINDGDQSMPYACGLHPGFRWPFADGERGQHRVVFEKPEQPEVPVLAPGGLVSGRKRPIPMKDGVLKLTDELFAADALCFLDPASRSLRFEDENGAAITLSLGEFTRAALWTRPGAPFLCLEAWTGYSDPEGFAGDLFEKPGMLVLAPGQAARHGAAYSFVAP
jgi:galactose mutarotase-like enzyme